MRVAHRHPSEPPSGRPACSRCSCSLRTSRLKMPAPPSDTSEATATRRCVRRRPVRHVRLALAITLVPPMAALLLTTRAAAAVDNPVPVDIPLTGPANGGSCPPANYVVVSPGGPSQVLLVVPPG